MLSLHRPKKNQLDSPNLTKFHNWASGSKPIILLAVVPSTIFFLIWMVFPLLYAGFMSLFEWRKSSISPVGQQFVGLENYLSAFQDPLFWLSLRNTLVLAVFEIVPVMIISLVLALLLNRIPARFQAFFRGIYFIPYITSLAALAIMWGWLYQPQFGLFNAILELFGGAPLRWLQDPKLALACIAAVVVFQEFGYGMILLLAGLQGIPAEYYEAAQVDGANSWVLFKNITLPLLRPSLLLVLVTNTIYSLQIFDPLFIMSVTSFNTPPGGPMNSTTTSILYIFIAAFKNYRGGYASAIAVMLFVIIMIVSLIQLRTVRTEWEY